MWPASGGGTLSGIISSDQLGTVNDQNGFLKKLIRNKIYILENINNKMKLDMCSTMSSLRTGILSLIRFNSGQDWDVED